MTVVKNSCIFFFFLCISLLISWLWHGLFGKPLPTYLRDFSSPYTSIYLYKYIKAFDDLFLYFYILLLLLFSFAVSVSKNDQRISNIKRHTQESLIAQKSEVISTAKAVCSEFPEIDFVQLHKPHGIYTNNNNNSKYYLLPINIYIYTDNLYQQWNKMN